MNTTVYGTSIANFARQRRTTVPVAIVAVLLLGGGCGSGRVGSVETRHFVTWPREKALPGPESPTLPQAGGCFELEVYSHLTLALALDDDAAIEGAREALSEPVHFPWYDKPKDDVRRIDVPPPPPPPQAGDWEWDTSPATGARQGRGGRSAFQQMMWFVVVGAIILLVAVIVFFLIRAFLKNEAGSERSKQEIAVGTDDDVDRVEALPFEVRRSKGDLLSEARRHYEAGNYNEAIVFFYSYLLVELDKSQLIRLTRGKTNRQYLREIRRQPLLHELLGLTMVAFEDVFFGHHQLPRSRFETCFHRLGEFEARIQEMVA